MIKIDYSGVMEKSVREHGIKEEELEKFDISKYHAALESKIDRKEIGFYDLPYQDTSKIKETAEQIRQKFRYFVVIGIGGSSLGNLMLHQALNHIMYNELPDMYPKFYMLDNPDPVVLEGIMRMVNPKETCFNVISKSGSTAETMANYLVARNELSKYVDKSKLPEHFIFTTDPSAGNLNKIADREEIKRLFIPQNVGGRFSVLTPVGLLSAAVTGIEIDRILSGAKSMSQICREPSLDNPGYLIAIIHYIMFNRGKNISVMMPYSNHLYNFADWYRQLWAESLGKRYSTEGKEINVGQTPIKSLGAIDQHSQIQLYNEGPNDKIITFIRVEKTNKDYEIDATPYRDIEGLSYLTGHTLHELLLTEQTATAVSLIKNKRPNLTITIDEITPENLGKLIFIYFTATAFSGELFHINAFNQPGVEMGKKYTYGLMGRRGFREYADEINKIKKEDFVLTLP
ncbi:MAG: glucose-6-phosphate isomerase [Synergistetes bacterium]|nr:glucose-6-phosphate isomerase [Synergistota bacterium]